MTTLIKNCCICGNEVETRKVLPFRDLIGSGVETYEMHIGVCNECGFIFNQNPLTEEQFEERYKNESKYEYDTEDNVFVASKGYKRRCARQKWFIDRNVQAENGGGIQVS